MALINSRMGSTPEKPPTGWLVLMWGGTRYKDAARRQVEHSAELSGAVRTRDPEQ